MAKSYKRTGKSRSGRTGYGSRTRTGRGKRVSGRGAQTVRLVIEHSAPAQPPSMVASAPIKTGSVF